MDTQANQHLLVELGGTTRKYCEKTNRIMMLCQLFLFIFDNG
jgi:hypothetical protein